MPRKNLTKDLQNTKHSKLSEILLLLFFRFSAELEL